MKRAERFAGIKGSVSLASCSFTFILGFNSEHLLIFLKQRIRLGFIQPQQSLRCWDLGGLLRAGPAPALLGAGSTETPFWGCRRGTGRTNGEEKKKGLIFHLSALFACIRDHPILSRSSKMVPPAFVGRCRSRWLSAQTLVPCTAFCLEHDS